MIHILDITSQMKADGIFVKSGPRTTGDGYYSCRDHHLSNPKLKHKKSFAEAGD